MSYSCLLDTSRYDIGTSNVGRVVFAPTLYCKRALLEDEDKTPTVRWSKPIECTVSNERLL